MGYRQHASQQVGDRDKMRNLWTQFKTARRMGTEYFERELGFYRDVRDRLEMHRDHWTDPSIGDAIAGKVSHLQRWIELRSDRIARLPL